MMWADNCLIFSDDSEINSMVNDIMEELMDLDMEPKPWSWWTSTHEAQVGATWRWDARAKVGRCFCGSFRIVESRDERTRT